MMLKNLVVLAVVSALVGCGGASFESPLFDDQDAAVSDPDAQGDAAKTDAALADSDAATQDAAQGDAAPEADAGQEQDSQGSDAQPEASQPEAGEDAAPESGPDVCVPGTCETLGKNCGPTPDGCGGSLACGTCPLNQSCGGGGTPNLCGGCVPDTCEAHGYKCGTMPDGCGNTITCGQAPVLQANSSCAGSGLPPNFWYCLAGTSATPALPPPFVGCKEFCNGYCCAEDHL